MRGDNGVAIAAQGGPMLAGLPAPGIAEYELRQEMQRTRRVAAVVRGYPHQDIVHAGPGVFDEHVEIPVIVEYPRIEQLVFRRADATAPIFRHQVGVGEGRLRVLIEHPQIGMRRSGIEIVVQFLHVFAVIALAVGQTEQALLQDRVALIPQRQGQAQNLVVVGKAGDAVLAPSVCAAAGMVMWKIVPGIAVRAIVLADRAPLPFA
nr:hypothetical protein [uncultured Rhodopila sp.]